MSCINSANLVYNGIKKNFSIKVEKPVLECPCNLLNLSSVTTPPSPLKSKNNIFIVSILDDTSLPARAYND